MLRPGPRTVKPDIPITGPKPKFRWICGVVKGLRWRVGWAIDPRLIPTMNCPTSLLSIAASVLALILASCANNPATAGADGKPADTPSKPVNPFPPGTYDHFKAEPEYPKTMKVWKNEELLSQTNSGNSRIVVSLSSQRAFLLKGDEVVIDYPVSSGRSSHPTPAGSYKILEKLKDKASNAYGKIYDADGKVVNSDADSRRHTVPEGGKFVGAPMPYWMRLTWDGVGHHIGTIPSSRRPVSHACIRGPRAVMPIVFSKVKVGTVVSVEG